MSARLIDALLERRVLVCCGSGGVGKTTMSAALGVAAARRGRSVLVCTIDPARRLANALGLRELGNEAYRVPDGALLGAGAPLAAGGALSAMMLDIKRTFDRLIERHARSPEVAERILRNHVYQQFSSQIAGSQEYMAMEKLYELVTEGSYDLVVLDTPPTKHALDFLHAPKRLSTFLEGSVLRWFLAPVRAGSSVSGLAARMAGKVVGWLDGVFGMKVLEELAEFFTAFEPLWGGFRERAEAVAALLGDVRQAAFVVVSSATPETVSESVYFHEQLREHALPMGGFVVNRVHPDILDGSGPGPLRDAARDPARRAALAAAIERALATAPAGAPASAGANGLARAATKALAVLADLDALARRDRESLTRIEDLAAREACFLRRVPAFEQDVHDLAGLAALDRFLVEAG